MIVIFILYFQGKYLLLLIYNRMIYKGSHMECRWTLNFSGSEISSGRTWQYKGKSNDDDFSLLIII